MIASPIYDEIVDFIAANTIPDRLVAFRPSNETKERVAELIQKEKNSMLSADEASELEHYLQLEHIMRLAKARSRRYMES